MFKENYSNITYLTNHRVLNQTDFNKKKKLIDELSYIKNIYLYLINFEKKIQVHKFLAGVTLSI